MKELSPRAIAKANGEKRYTSSRRCKWCNGTERYTSSGGCTFCPTLRYGNFDAQDLRKQARENRTTASLSGSKTYEGMICTKCNGTLRYVSYGNCVHCATRASGNIRMKRAQVFHAEAALLVIIDTPPAPEIAPYYLQCPEHTQGTWVAWSDCKHMAPSGIRLYTGHDVLQRPELLQMLLNQAARLSAERVPVEQWHTDLQIAWKLRHGYHAALSGFNKRYANNGKRKKWTGYA